MLMFLFTTKTYCGFSGGSDGKGSACNTGDLGWVPGSGRCPGEGKGNPLQGSHLENPMDRGAWQSIAHEVTQIQQPNMKSSSFSPAKSAMCWAILPGSSPPLMAQRSRLLFFCPLNKQPPRFPLRLR